MVDIIEKTVVTTGSVFDVVVLRIGGIEIIFPYQSAFEICNGIKMAAKLALRIEGNKIALWREMAVVDHDPEPLTPNRKFRQSGKATNLKNWAISFEGALVVMQFNESLFKLHYSEALPLYTWLRVAARRAKAWAGDRSRTMRTTAYLNDAEENYKHGYNG